jgi:hypothetical protein
MGSSPESSTSTLSELLSWALQPDLAAACSWRMNPGSTVAGATARLVQLEYLHHQAAEHREELAEFLEQEQLDALNLMLSRAVRDAQRSVAVEQAIEARQVRRWRRARPSEGPSIDDFRDLVTATRLPAAWARGGRESHSTRRASRRAPEGSDDGPGEPGAAA